MTQVSDLAEIAVDEVSIVKRPATGRVFAFLKANESGDIELSQEVVSALGEPLADEAGLVEKLQQGGMDESTVEAGVAVARLTKAFPSATYVVLKSWQAQHTQAEQDAIDAGASAASDLGGTDEPDADDAPQNLKARLLKALDSVGV